MPKNAEQDCVRTFTAYGPLFVVSSQWNSQADVLGVGINGCRYDMCGWRWPVIFLGFELSDPVTDHFRIFRSSGFSFGHTPK
jgi:hypothetical protein